MKQFKEQDYTINICTDIIEWAKEFYDMPNGAILANEEEVNNECMGFACIEDKEIWVFVPEKYNYKDLKETISHEIGHIIEFKHPFSPEQTEGNDDLHEQKADHYMDFFMVTEKIILETVKLLD